MTYADTTTDTDTAAPWAHVSARDSARALLALGGAIDDAAVLADALTARAVYADKAPTAQALLDAHKAATKKVALAAVRIVRERVKARRAKRQARYALEDRQHERNVERRRLGEPVPRTEEPRWAVQSTAERLHRLRVDAIAKAWDAAGFRSPASRWVEGAGERLHVVTTPNAHETPHVTTKSTKVWDRRRKEPGTRLSRTALIRTSWRADVLHRGLVGLRRRADEGLFFLDARPEGDGLWVAFLRPGRGFDLVREEAVLVRSPSGGWSFPTARRGSKGVR